MQPRDHSGNTVRAGSAEILRQRLRVASGQHEDAAHQEHATSVSKMLHCSLTSVSLSRIDDTTSEEDRAGRVVADEEQEGTVDDEPERTGAEVMQDDRGRGCGSGSLLVDLDSGLMEDRRN